MRFADVEIAGCDLVAGTRYVPLHCSQTAWRGLLSPLIDSSEPTPTSVTGDASEKFPAMEADLLTRVRAHYSHHMTAAARLMAPMKVLMLRSKRVAIRRQSLKRQNMRSTTLRCL